MFYLHRSLVHLVANHLSCTSFAMFMLCYMYMYMPLAAHYLTVNYLYLIHVLERITGTWRMDTTFASQGWRSTAVADLEGRAAPPLSPEIYKMLVKLKIRDQNYVKFLLFRGVPPPPFRSAPSPFSLFLDPPLHGVSLYSLHKCEFNKSQLDPPKVKNKPAVDRHPWLVKMFK
jgi:hypothetical protein